MRHWGRGRCQEDFTDGIECGVEEAWSALPGGTLKLNNYWQKRLFRHGYFFVDIINGLSFFHSSPRYGGVRRGLE